MIKSSDFFEIMCPQCRCLHAVPKNLWEVCLFTRNDDDPRRAYCPYGHPYTAIPDKKERPLEQPEPRELPANVVEFRKDKP